MNTKVTIPTAGIYTVRFKYQGKGFGADGVYYIKVAFDDDKQDIWTGDWDGAKDNEKWNSTRYPASSNYDDYRSK